MPNQFDVVMVFRYIAAGLLFLFQLFIPLSAQVHLKYGLSLTTGEISSSFRSNDTLFIAGAFSRIGYTCGSLARYKGTQRDVLDESIPYMTGEIRALEADGSGGWYVAGGINYAGQTRGPLFHILANGSVDMNFQFSTPQGLVNCIKLHNGSLYVGGTFTIVNSVQVRNIVKVDASNGFVDATWNPGIQENQYGEVKDIAIHQNKIIVAGYFTQSIGGAAGSLAAFNNTNGSLVFNYNTPGTVNKIKVEQDTLWSAGEFSSMLGFPVSNLAKINLSNNALLTSFNPAPTNSRILSFDITQESVYIGGNFSQAGGQNRQGIASLNRVNGNLNAGFQPNLGGTPAVGALTVYNNQILISGPFTQVNNTARRNMAELNRFNGTLSGWNPGVESGVTGMYTSGNDLIIYGSMNYIGVEERSAFAAINLNTRKLLPLKINLTGFNIYVYGMARNGKKLYLSGILPQVNGVAISSSIAEVDLISGVAREVPIVANNSVTTLGIFQNRLYFMGPFTEVGGQPRNQAASIDLPSFTLNNWNPKVFGYGFTQIEGHNGKLFLCGNISGIGTENQYGIAAVDPVSGANTGFKPGVVGSVRKALFVNNRIYIAGDFSEVGQQPRKGLALLNEDGTLVPQFEVPNNGASNLHQHIVLMNGNLIAARDTQSGNANMRFRAYDALSGQLTSALPMRMTRPDQFSPLPNCTGMYPVDSVLVVAGAFNRVNGLNSLGLAFIDFRISEPPQTLSQIYPNRHSPVAGAELFLYGKGFTPNAAVTFSKSGQTDYQVPAQLIEYLDPWTIRLKLNLEGWQTGLWQVKLTIDNNIVLNMQGGLTIEAETPYKLEVFMTGPINIGRNDRPYYHLYFRNTGNTIVKGVPLYYAVSPQATLYNTGPVSGTILTQVVENPFDKDIFPPNTFTPFYAKTSKSGDPFNIYPYILPTIKSYESGKLTIALHSPQLGSFDLSAWFARPWIIKDKVNPQVIKAILDAVKNLPGGENSSKEEAENAVTNTVNNSLGTSSGTSTPPGNNGGGSVGGGGGGGGGLPPATYMVYETDLTIIATVKDVAEQAGVSDPASYGPSIADDVMEDFLPDEDWDPFCTACFPYDPNDYSDPDQDSIPFSADSLDKPGKADKSTAIRINVLASKDPNAKYGPQGILGNKYLNSVFPFSYMIAFENDPEATAPAREVIIRDTLDKNVYDLSTFTLGDISFGKFSIFIPPGQTIYRNRINLNPRYNKWVDIDARLNQNTGVFTLILRSIDPATGEFPISPLDGFLPPNNEANEGQGSVSFYLRLKDGLEDGTSISNRASIIFDDNEAIITNTYTNVLDRVKPESSVNQIAGDGPTYTISGIGSDVGSGIYSYAIYQRINGGLWKELRRNLSELSSPLTLSTDSMYQFVSLSVDSAGNLETWPEVPDLNFPATGLKEVNQNNLLTVYPNPSSGLLHIQNMGSAAMNRIEVLDMQGRIVMQQASGSYSEMLNIAALEKGVYSLLVHLNDKSRLVKVIQKY
jgi:hypothetical protein